MIGGVRGIDFEVRTGVDLVSIAEFREALERRGDTMRPRLFTPSEVAGATVERLAGMFAAKEAAFKALALPKGDWHVLEIGHDGEGRPYIEFAERYDSSHIVSLDLSISHTDEYAVASVMALVSGR